ncbi:MAG: hydrogenase formation protein HypD [Armatimonadetes bacterium CG07_land_8_20_14_0_80_40_9]|nr:MAG: hydrogenase formation protein HypD [Armatimonadetes bacterium CG07_land_8_20_14_0_80_40_9]
MKYLDEFRDKRLAKGLVDKICSLSGEGQAGTPAPTFMEVCGTHTVAILRSGIKELLKGRVNMLSGPGCPVCVTATSDLDKTIALTKIDQVILTTFGDMLKVPGSFSSLQKERAEGYDIRIVYSCLDALKIAEENLDKTIIFLAIGFETTAPTIASSIISAHKEGLNNFFILSVHKLIPPAMKALLDMGEVNLDGFICPGHVSAIIGSLPYQFIAQDYKIPCVITGFEPLDVLQAMYMLLMQKKKGESKVEIQYSRGVPQQGNPKAMELMDEVFEVCDARWRGLGIIGSSGLKLKERYERFDAEKNFNIQVEESKEHPECRCGEILRGIIEPAQCKLFAKICTPEYPVGPCMVSSEGTCAAYYKWGQTPLVGSDPLGGV